MDLIDRLKKIAEMGGIPEEKLILKEAEWFFEEHRHHGIHQIQLDFKRRRLSAIRLYCTADELVHTGICSHQGQDYPQNAPSVVYSSRKTEEMTYQKRRREA